MAQRKGGSNYIELFKITSNAFADSEKILNQIYKCDVARRADLGIDVTIDQDEDTQALETFLEDYRVPESTGGSAGKLYEDGGDPSTGGGTSETLIGAIIYSGKGSTDLKTVRGCFKVDPTSGSYSTENDVESHPTFKLVSVAAPAEITVPIVAFNTDLVTAPGAAKTIAAGNKGKVEFLTKAVGT